MDQAKKLSVVFKIGNVIINLAILLKNIKKALS